MVQKTRQVWQAVVSTKQGVIWIIFGKQHQHSQFQKWHAYSTFFIPSLLLIYLLLNSCDGKCAKQRVSSVDYEKSWLCNVLALKRAGFSLADVQSDVICLHPCCAQSRFLHWPTASKFCDMLVYVTVSLMLKDVDCGPFYEHRVTSERAI